MHKKYFLGVLLTFVLLSSIAAETSVSIAFFNKQVYVPTSEIYIRITVKNDTAQTWRFKMADDKRFTVGFSVTTMSNRSLEASDSWKRAMASSIPAMYRELSLEPGEEYSFVESLKNYVTIAEPGTYIVFCTMYPELSNRSSINPMRSNNLSLSVRPGLPSPTLAESFSSSLTEILRAEKIGPDEVVSRTIRSRQKGQWNEFFLYLDIERLMLANSAKARSYSRESDDGRRRILNEYKTELMAGVTETDIILIPSSFEILETRYGSLMGTVIVMQKYQYDGFRMLKEYTYDLERRDDIWYITGYSVVNRGTE
jgi:hypothetical protein